MTPDDHPLLSQPAPQSGRSAPSPATLQVRAVHRAMADLKRGTPVILAGLARMALVAAETVGAAGLAELGTLAEGDPVLLLAATRAAALFDHDAGDATQPAVRAIALPRHLLDPAILRGMADPTAAQLLPEQPRPAPLLQDGQAAIAQSAIALAKLARLLPALVAVPLSRTASPQSNLLTVDAADILAYPTSIATGLARVAEAVVPLEDVPDARVVAFRAADSGIEHLAILVGRPEDAEIPLVRLHSECFTGDVLGSLRCDCGPQLRGALRRMQAEGAGALLYLAQEGRGIGLANKLRAYALQDRGMDTVDANRALGWGADERNFLLAATMLEQLGISRIRLLTNNPDKVAAMTACGVEVVSRERHVFAANGINDRYLATKTERFGHLE